jgi:hypothetical protein
VDSLIGLQFRLPVNERTEFVWQPVSKGENNWNVETEWAFGAFEVNNNLSVRVGRLRIPFFRLSDSLLVSYSQLWVRPPIDMYDQFAFSRFTGIDALISFPLGDSDVLIQPIFGSSASDFEMMGQVGEFSIKNLAGVNVIWSYDWLTLRIGQIEGDYDVSGAAFVGMEALADNVLASTGSALAANQLRIKDRHGSFTSLGVDINYNDFLLLSEYGKRKTDGLMADNTSYYITVGYNIGAFTPHLTFSRYQTDEEYSDIQSMIGGPNDIGVDGTAVSPTNPSMYALMTSFNTVNQSSITAGLRWDILVATALKFEWQRVMPDKESSLLSPPFVGPEGGPGPSSTYFGQDLDDIDLYTISIDFIF